MRPQNNPLRSFVEIKGPWKVRFEGGRRTYNIPASSSWNEIFPEKRDFLGPASYTVKFRKPAPANGRATYIRFGSVNYIAKVSVNGRYLGMHEGGHLPFEFGIPARLLKRTNILSVEIDGRLAPDRVPPGNVIYDSKDAFANSQYPATSFDFFPYCGIHRKVCICTRPISGIDDITVRTSIKGKDGIVTAAILAPFSGGVKARFEMAGVAVEVPVKHCKASAVLKIKNARLWAPGKPELYDLKVTLTGYGRKLDEYTLPVGVRTVSIKGSSIRINNKPVFLKGFGRHEDYPGKGRGFDPEWNKVDFKNLLWTGANSFRTSHYPYDEEQMDMADRLGIMVIDETPAVGMYFNDDGLEKREKLCRQYVRELIARDKNHPSVIMWSLANEPFSNRPEAGRFFKSLAGLAHSLDSTRPATIASYLGAGEEAFNYLDVVCVNRYMGWYTEQGRLDLALPKLSKDLDAIYKKFKKPVIISEFGADALPGLRSKNPEMFTEDYQKAMIKAYVELAAKKPYIAGTHVWNLCDFKTGQGVHRPGGMNWKGVFTRNRRLKLAARFLRKYWKGR